jgi:hypothetical protein
LLYGRATSGDHAQMLRPAESLTKLAHQRNSRLIRPLQRVHRTGRSRRAAESTFGATVGALKDSFCDEPLCSVDCSWHWVASKTILSMNMFSRGGGHRRASNELSVTQMTTGITHALRACSPFSQYTATWAAHDEGSALSVHRLFYKLPFQSIPSRPSTETAVDC